MKSKSALLVTVLAILLTSCKPSQRILTSWVNPERPQKTYNNVFVAVLIQNNAVKYAIEGDLGEAVKSRGFKVVHGYELFPPNFNKDNMRDRDVALNAIRNKGCDVILSVAVIDVKSETHYVQSSSSPYYSPYGGYGAYGHYGAYGPGFYGYYMYWQPTIYTDSYYTTDNTYFIEANAYDADTQQLIWSLQTKAYNPKDIEKSSKEYTKLLIEQFDKERKKTK